MPDFSFMKDSEGRIQKAIDKVGRGLLARAFQNSIFVYGTTGGAFVGRAIQQWRSVLLRNRLARNDTRDFRELNIYDPGPRTRVALDNQMMDLYYGQEGTLVHQRRNRTIGEYVHYAMCFSAFYNHRISGRDAYLNTFGRDPDGKGGVIEGWQSSPRPPNGFHQFDGFYYPDPDAPGKGLTATKEMSRIIRTGIYELGGTLIFEGTNVTYQSVFIEGGFVSDTSLEAENLFKFFTPGKSRVQFGRGEIVFHWHGQETVPGLNLFHENWLWGMRDGKPVFHKKENFGQPKPGEKIKDIYNNFLPFSPGSLANKAFSAFSESFLKQKLKNL